MLIDALVPIVTIVVLVSLAAIMQLIVNWIEKWCDDNPNDDSGEDN